MTLEVVVILFEVSVMGTTLPLFGEEEKKQPPQVATTERVAFAPGGVILVNDSYGDLNVEGWDRPEVEITVIKSMPYDYKRKRPEESSKRLDSVRVVSGRKSNTEMVVSTLPHKGRDGVRIQYEIHAPRASKLVIHHGTGSVFVNDISGDIEATCGRGDVVLMLRDAGAYPIDAKSKFGTVISDFERIAHIRRYRLGERYATTNLPSSRRIQLRMGFGGITIKAVPIEAYAASGTN